MMLDQIKNYLLIALALGVAVAFFYGLHEGKGIGRADCENTQNAAIKKLTDELNDTKAKSRARIAALTAEADKRRRTDNATIKKLLATNKKLREWWDQKVPKDAENYIYGTDRSNGS